MAAYSYIEGNPVPDQERQETRPVLLYHYAGNTLPRGSPAAAGVNIANRSLVECASSTQQVSNFAGKYEAALAVTLSDVFVTFKHSVTFL